MANFEMVGAPAVGKTTILKELERRWTPDQAWMLDHRFPKGGPRTARAESHDILNTFILENSDFYERLADFCLNHYMGRSGKKVLFDKFSRLNNSLEIIALSHAFNDKYPIVLMDECILKHCSALVDKAQDDKNAEVLLLDNRLASGFIIVDGPTDLVCRRFIRRAERVRIYTGNEYDYIRKETDASLRRWRRLAALLKRLSRPCLVLDSTEPVAENADRVIEFVERDLPLPASSPAVALHSALLSSEAIAVAVSSVLMCAL